MVVAPKPPVKTTRVHAVSPERHALEIRFPRVAGYRVELPAGSLKATFSANSGLTLTPDQVGPSTTQNLGIVGEDLFGQLKAIAQEWVRDQLTFADGTWKTQVMH